MKPVFSLSCALMFAAGMAQSQAATEVGPSGNDAYPVEVVAADGTRYFCGAQNVVLDGRTVRRCIRPRAGGTDPFGGGGGGLAIAGVGLGLVALAVRSSDTTN